jgi:hypothetical protein
VYGTQGQAAVGLVAGLGLLILVTAGLAAALLSAAPAAWEATIAERARARHEVLRTSGEMRMRWHRPEPGSGDHRGG